MNFAKFLSMPFLQNTSGRLLLNRTAFYKSLSKQIYELSTFILQYIYIQYVHWISVTLLQNDQNKEQIQKSQTYYFCFAECKYAAYLLNQHRQLTKKMFAVLLLVTVSSIKSEAATGGVL